MRSLLWLSVVTLVALPGSAFARFGKAHTDHDESSGSHSSSSSSSSSHPDSHYHSAESPNSPSASSSSGGYSTGYAPYHRHSHYYPRYAWGFGYAPVWGPPVAYAYPGGSVQTQAIPVVTTVAMNGQAIKDGVAIGADLTLEGPQFGIDASLHSVFVGADDGTSATDAIHLANLHLTYALISTPQGRLRIEGGVDSAVAPDITMVGPGFGLSGALGLYNQISASFGIEVTPYPFKQVDGHAGMAVNFGALALNGGYRVTWLDDEGRVDGIDNQDTFAGPYIGLALAL